MECGLPLRMAFTFLITAIPSIASTNGTPKTCCGHFDPWNPVIVSSANLPRRMKRQVNVMSKTTYGTSHFVSREMAVRYYADYEQNPLAAVEYKLQEGSIHIGKPEVKPGQELSVIDNGARYAITENNNQHA